MDASQFLEAAFWDSEEPIYLEGSGLESPLTQVSGLPAGAVVFSSSGSSGVKKWVVHTRQTLRASAEMVNQHLQVTEQDRFCLLIPPYHVGGFGVLARAYTSNCPATLYEGKWNAQRAADLLTTSGATITSMVPTQVYDLVEAGIGAPLTLRAIVVGGGSLDLDLGQRARDLGWNVLQSYGMSEAGSQIATANLLSLSEPYRNSNLTILDGWDLASTAEGLLRLEGQALCMGLITEAEAGLEYTERARPFVSNDRVELSAADLTFLGRADRVIKVRGELVDLDELEAELSVELDTLCCLVPSDHARLGHTLYLFIEGAGSGTCNLSAVLPKYVALQGVIEIERIPRSALGKVDRRALSALQTGASG